MFLMFLDCMFCMEELKQKAAGCAPASLHEVDSVTQVQNTCLGNSTRLDLVR